MSGIDEQQVYEEDDYSDFPICHYCASRRYKRDWRDLGSATIEVDDGDLIAHYHSAEDFVWHGGWRCEECGEDANEGDQTILNHIFSENSGDG